MFSRSVFVTSKRASGVVALTIEITPIVHFPSTPPNIGQDIITNHGVHHKSFLWILIVHK